MYGWNRINIVSILELSYQSEVTVVGVPFVFAHIQHRLVPVSSEICGQQLQDVSERKKIQKSVLIFISQR